MKKGIFGRIVLTIYLIIVIAFSVILLLGGIGALSFEQIGEYIADIDYISSVTIPIIIISLILLILSFSMLFSGKEGKRQSSALVKNTDLGIIHVSFSTLNTMAQKAVRKFNEVKDVKSIIISEIDGVKVNIKIIVMPDVKIPELTQSIQKEVKEYIETTAGISVKEVQIFVENLSTFQKGKVE